MQIVIELPKEEYELCKKYDGHLGDHRAISYAIKNGTPLPKGHGRLIDADILDEVKEMVTTDTSDYKYAVLMDSIRLIPTIIEVESEKV